MEQLPKGVRERLAAAQNGAVSSHPDADTLNAFTENVLLRSERERVIEHLAVCADCREVVALSLPQEVAAEPAPAATHISTSAPLRWNIFRWAGLAAAVIVVSAAVLIYKSKTADIAGREAASSPVVATRTTPAQPADKKEQAPPPPLASQRELAGATRRSEAPPASSGVTSHYSARVKKDEVPERKAETAVGGASETVEVQAELASVQNEQAPSFSVSAEQSRNKAFDTLAKSEAKPQADARSRVAMKVAGGNQAQLAQNQQLPAQAVPPPPVANEARADQNAAYGRNYSDDVATNATVYENSAAAPAVNGKSSNQAEKDKNSIPTNPVQNSVVTAESTAELRGLTVNSGSRPALAPVANVNWRISDAGSIERSERNGTWRRAIAASDIRFRSIATAGRDVWAGGSNGALYHSSNAGGSWTRITVASGNQALTGDVVHINFVSSQELQITTSTGQTWMTRDGGNTWTAR